MEEKSTGAEGGKNALGEQLRTSRRHLKMTMKEVADTAGLSVGFISQVERGLTAPSLSSLTTIAQVLGTDVSNFLIQPSGSSPLTRHRERPTYSVNNTGLYYERISASFPGNLINSVIIHEMPGYKSEAIQHQGEELFFILEGAITINIEGVDTVLETGDSIHFESTRRHSAWNHTDKPVVLLHVGTMNVFGDKTAGTDVPGIHAGHGLVKSPCLPETSSENNTSEEK